MKFETKFNIGQTVYKIGSADPMTVKQMILTQCEGERDITYCCEFGQPLDEDWFIEDQLTAEKPKPKTIYDLEHGDKYFILNASGISTVMFLNDCIYKSCIESGNAFSTLAEAEKELKRRKIHQQLKKLAGDYKFDSDSLNYAITFDIDVYATLWAETRFSDCVYFKSLEDAENAIKIIGKEVLARDYFGVDYCCDYDRTPGSEWFTEKDLTSEKSKPKTIYDLVEGDKYFFLTGEGHIIVDTFDDSELDNERIIFGSVFLNREEAEKERKRRKIHLRLKELAGGYKFRNGKNNYCLYFSAEDNRLEVIELRNMHIPNTVYFETGEQARNAIEKIGEEVLIRYYFGIEK